MGSGLSKKASSHHMAEIQENNKETTLVLCNCDKIVEINENGNMINNALEQEKQVEHTSVLQQNLVSKSKSLDKDELMNKTGTATNASLTNSVWFNNDHVNQCNLLDETPHYINKNNTSIDNNYKADNYSSCAVTSKENSQLEIKQWSHANRHVLVAHNSLEEIESDTTPLNCSVKGPTLLKINPLTPPSLSLIASRQESSTTPLYRKTRKSSWGHGSNNNNIVKEHVSNTDNVLCQRKVRNHEDVDSLMSLSSDISSEIEKDEKENKKNLIKEQSTNVEEQQQLQICVQQQEESQTNHVVMNMQTNTEGNEQRNIDQSIRLCAKHEESTRHKMHTDHALHNTKDNNNNNNDDNDVDNFVLFPSLQTKHNWRHSSSLVSNESTSFITATSSCNTNTNTDLNNDNNNYHNNNGATIKSEFPLFFVRPSIATNTTSSSYSSSTSCSVPTNSQVLDTPLNNKSDHRLAYTSGNSATYLLDPPSLNNYIERHAKLLHSAPQSNSILPLGGNECTSKKSSSDMKSTDHSSMIEVPSMETLLNCSFDSRAFANLSKSFHANDFMHDTRECNYDKDSNKRSSCHLGVGNTTMHHLNSNGSNKSNEIIKEHMPTSQKHKEIEITKMHVNKEFSNAPEEFSHFEHKKTTCHTTHEGEANEMTDNCCHDNIVCNTAVNNNNNNNNTITSNSDLKTEPNTHNAMEIIGYLSHFVHESANKESNSMRWFRTNVETYNNNDSDKGNNNSKEISCADRQSEQRCNIDIIREQLRERREQRKNRLCNSRNEKQNMCDSTQNISWEPYEYNEADDWEDNIINVSTSSSSKEKETEKEMESVCKEVYKEIKESELTDESNKKIECNDKSHGKTSTRYTKMTLSLTSSGKWKAMPISPILLTQLSSNSSNFTDSASHLTNNKKVIHSSYQDNLIESKNAANESECSFNNAHCDRLSLLRDNNKISYELEQEHPLQLRHLHHEHIRPSHHHHLHHHLHHHSHSHSHDCCLCDDSDIKEKGKHQAHTNITSNKHKRSFLLSLSSSSSSSSEEESFSSSSEELSSLCNEPHTMSEKTSKPFTSPRSSALIVVECAECSKRSPQINVIVPPSVSLSHLSRVNNESSANVSQHGSLCTSVSYHNDMNHVQSIEADEAILNPLNEMTEFVAAQCYDCDGLGLGLGMCKTAKTNSLTSTNMSSDGSGSIGSSSNDISKSDIDKRTTYENDLEHDLSTEAERIKEEGNPFFCPSNSNFSSTENLSSVRYNANSPLLSVTTTSSSSLPTSSSSLEEMEHTSLPYVIATYHTPKTSFSEVHNSTNMNSEEARDNHIKLTLCNANEQTRQQTKSAVLMPDLKMQTSAKDESLHANDKIIESTTATSINTTTTTTRNVSHIRKHRKPIISASMPFKQQLAKRADEDYELFVMFRRRGNTVLKHNIVDDNAKINDDKICWNNFGNENDSTETKVNNVVNKRQENIGCVETSINEEENIRYTANFDQESELLF